MGRLDKLREEREEREGGRDENREEVEKLQKHLREEKLKKDQVIKIKIRTRTFFPLLTWSNIMLV